MTPRIASTALIVTLLAAIVVPVGASAFGAGSLPLLTYPTADTTPTETPTRGICLLCPTQAG
ncbi:MULTISPECIES: hypothetical protein [unclassified Marinovum]